MLFKGPKTYVGLHTYTTVHTCIHMYDVHNYLNSHNCTYTDIGAVYELRLAVIGYREKQYWMIDWMIVCQV